MIITVEISHYPLNQEYETSILSLIDTLKTNPRLIVVSNAMSTQLKGEVEEVFHSIKKGLLDVYQNQELSSTVLKIINKDLPIENGILNF